MTDSPTTTIGNHDYAVLSGSVGPDVVDIRKFYAQTGMFTYDPGFTSTASCESGLTYIDGDEGILLHRGYPIGQLAENSNFMEVSYLLLNGELPSKPMPASKASSSSCELIENDLSCPRTSVNQKRMKRILRSSTTAFTSAAVIACSGIRR